MDKRRSVILLLLLSILLAGCQEEQQITPKEQPLEEQATPEIRFLEYISHWEQADFTGMYGGYLTEGTKMAFGQETFVAWQQQLHQDLGIENVSISYQKPDTGVGWSKSEPADFPIQITMDTAAGPVEFSRTLTMLFETQEETADWYVEWNPSFIFPQLEEGDLVEIERTDPERGEIHDRNRKPIAVNGKGFEVGIVPANFDEAKKKNDLAALLNITPGEIDEKLNQSWVQPGHYVPLAVLPAKATDALQQIFAIPGTEQKEVPLREYPYGAALSHVSGYIGPITAEQLKQRQGQGYEQEDLIGRQGLESILEDRLRGEQGVRILIQKPHAGSEPIIAAEKPAKQGDIIKLTIDAELQKTVYQAMSGKAGTSAAVDPKTGETLVLFSSPGFNPNDFILGISGSAYRKLQKDPLNPLFNRFAATYAPGTTIQPVTAAIGIKLGTLDPAEGLEINGKTWQRVPSWGNYRVERMYDKVPNPIDLNKALVYSDNIYFARQAMDIGRDALVDGLKQFGFGEEIPFPTPLISSQISNEGTLGSEGQLADTSLGEGQMQVNILHLAAMYEPFFTAGTIYKPTFFLEEEDGQVWKKELIDAENAEIIRTSLRKAVAEGFPEAASLSGVPLAGKSGTAQNRLGENDYFVGYNSDYPLFILALMIENQEKDENSEEAAARAAEVFKAWK
ncbi:penicillin-binding transpeptidase domain-containing protein [Planococcus shenhongbingii]|uniref:Penicillin-binding transpeptidase domain-containing protein n=1 Tax=Planococcus shenhongbingii TaxID=3058398 RepID=A0ABT8NF31_9BACL|nr:penicillin-binding transpeptidase domain-containing protein [Planococcus sp. N017]MDN7246496.1 penicillin-binding transpeptidase domain-containing protein [Planococcus sp. N017]